ncbi:MAG: PAS domain S-box protein [Candidatus Magnetominusculus sp. LBB02]|nr:PAS domain S-box protein [Candidatus Magnetominusculus sp. LBB02]
MMRDLDIGVRITIGYFCMLFVFLLLSLISIYKLNSSTDKLKTLYEHPFEVKGRLLSIKADTYKVRILMRRVAVENDENKIVELKSEISSLESELINDLNLVENLYLGDKALIQHIRSHYEVYIRLHEEFYNLLSEGRQTEALNLLNTKMYENVRHTDALIKEAVDFASNMAASLYESALKTEAKAKNLLLILLAIALILTAALSIAFTRMITAPISRLVEAVEEVGSGNLNVPIDDSADDEIGELATAFKEMLGSLRDYTFNLRLQGEIMSNMSEGVVLVRADNGTIVYSSQRFDEMFAYNAGELTGKNISVINAPSEKTPEQTASEISELLARNKTWQGEVLNIKKTGERLWCFAAVSSFEHNTYGLVWISVHTDITASKKAQDELKRFFDLSIDMLCIAGNDGYFKILSQSFEKTLGYTLDELKSRPFIEFVHPDDREATTKAVEVAFQGTPVYKFHNRYLCKDGSHRDISWTALAIPEEGLSYCNATDVTKQKKLEESLAQSEERFRTVFENAPIGVAITNAETGEFIKVNREYCNIIGYSYDELIGLKFHDITHPGDIERQMDGLRLLNCGEMLVFNMEKRYIHKNSKIIWARIAYISLPSRPNEPQLTLAIVEDITERKQMAEALIAERNKLKSIMDTMEDGVYIVNKDHEIEFINKSLMNEFGEVSGRKCYEYLYDKTDQCSWCKNDEVFEGKTIRWEWHFEKNNRTYAIFDTPLRNIDESICKFEIFHDITDIKRAQALIQKELNFQTAIAAVSETLLAPDMTIQDIAGIVHRQAMSLTGSLHGYVGELDAETEDIRSHAMSDMANQPECRVDPRYFRMAFPKGKDGYNALWGYALNTKQGFYTNDPSAHPAYKGVIPEGHVVLRRFLSVPAVIGDKLIGQIALANAARDYTDEDLNIIERLAAVFALAVERKKMEEKLNFRKDFLQKVIDNTTNAVYSIGLNGNFLLVNHQVSEITGYSSDELTGSPFAMLFDNYALPRVNELFLKASVFGELVENYETNIVRKDGERRIITITVSPIYEDDKISMVVGTAEDITQRRQLEIKLQEVNAQLHAIIDSTNAVVFLKDINGRYKFVNSQFEQLFHVTKEGMIGKTDYDIFPAELADKLRANDIAVQNTNAPTQFEEIVPNNDGLHTYIAVKFPLHNIGGRVYGVCGIATDITERKEMEERLRVLNLELESKVVEETQMRRQGEQMLIQQSKMAAMGEMLGLITHQWRQPLNAVSIIVQDIKEAYAYGELTEKYLQESVETTMSQVLFMAKTIDDFKDFFKPTKEKISFDVKAAVDELLGMFGVVFKKNDVKISLAAAQDVLMISEGYPNEFKQVVLNILNNAKDAITAKRETGNLIRGCVKINMVTESDKIIISIKDNGGGIPQHVLGRVFEPYFTTKGDAGTGIGLYMSKTIIEQNMGGSLNVRNVDDGAEFIIELGLSKADAARD